VRWAVAPDPTKPLAGFGGGEGGERKGAEGKARAGRKKKGKRKGWEGGERLDP